MLVEAVEVALREVVCDVQSVDLEAKFGRQAEEKGEEEIGRY